MPIRINLLAEAQAAEESRRKDPVKRAVWIAGFVVFLVLLWSGTLQLKIAAVKSDISGVRGTWSEIEAKVKQAENQRNRLRELETKLSSIDQFTTNRMLWANTLNALQYTVVENVRLVRLKTAQSFIYVEGTKPRTNNSVVIPGKPGSVTEKVALSLEAKDYSPRPGDQVPQFKQTLADNPFFRTHLQKTNNVQLTMLSAPQNELGRGFVSFGFQLFYHDTERRTYE